jgi:arylsulfatase A-like enzyme
MQFDCEAPALAERLSEAGLRTRAFSANPNVSPTFGFDRGFDEFTGSWRVRSMDDSMFDWENFIALHKDDGAMRFPKALIECLTTDCATIPSLKYGVRMKLRDLGIGASMQDDGAREALSYVRDLSPADEEFLFVNPSTVEGLSAYFNGLDDDPETIQGAYDDSVRYLSSMYEDIFAELQAKYDVILTVSDHGEMLGEHGIWEHPFGLYEPLTHVPLSVWRRDHPEAAERRDELVNLFDVHATVCDVAGLDTERGASLVDGDSDRGAARYLTEFHGVKLAKRKRLEQQGHTDLDFLTEELCGLLSDSYYGFETFDDEFIERGDWGGEGTPQDALAAEVAAREVRETNGSGDGELNAATRRQLEELGYL